MNAYYITADRIGSPTGGGAVTFNESTALCDLCPTRIWGRGFLEGGDDPWGWDRVAHGKLLTAPHVGKDTLVHFYSGCMTQTVRRAKAMGAKVSYMCEAHRVSDSRRAHEELGWPYPYPHLTEFDQWRNYSGGYWDADLLIAPSQHSANVLAEQYYALFGKKDLEKRIKIISHGHNPPERITNPPDVFTVGYMGAIGPDKGIRYLLEAWKMLGYRDAMLYFAGRESTTPLMWEFVHKFGGGNVGMLGWVDDVSDFYNGITVYVQPSATEGFGLEVVEAMAHLRPVIVSDHAGAVDLVRKHQIGMEFPACNAKMLAEAIDYMKKSSQARDISIAAAQQVAPEYTWAKVRERYQTAWKELIHV